MSAESGVVITRRALLAGVAGIGWAAPVEGSVLVHEHVLVDFGGVAAPGRYDRSEVFRLALPKLEEVKKLGCRRFLDCTPNYLGRDVELLARLAQAAGLEIWTNTGIYGAANRAGVPSFARQEPAAELARRFIAEARTGVSGVKPRFIKTGIMTAPLDELDRKLTRAAAIASRETGLTVASHTGRGAAAFEQLEILASEKVRPSKFVWVHAQNEKDHALHEKVARVGAWVEFDALQEGHSEWQRECVGWMAERGLLSRTLIANDSGWYHVGEPGGGQFNGYAYLYTGFLPMLEPGWRAQLMVTNPVAAFG